MFVLSYFLVFKNYKMFISVLVRIVNGFSCACAFEIIQVRGLLQPTVHSLVSSAASLLLILDALAAQDWALTFR